MTPDELKARLLAEAEVIINELGGQAEACPFSTLDEIEQAALKAVEQVKASGLAGLVRNAPQGAAGARCAQGGGN